MNGEKTTLLISRNKINTLTSKNLADCCPQAESAAKRIDKQIILKALGPKNSAGGHLKCVLYHAPSFA